MTELSPAARQTLAAAGITEREWIAYGGWYDVEVDAAGDHQLVRDGQWHGDWCGCTDDRCIGHHHDARDECGCLPVLIAQRNQAHEAHAIWHEYRASVEANGGRGDQAAYDAAWSRAEAWIRAHHPRALTFSLDAIVKGERGISATFPPLPDGSIPQWTGTVPEDDGYRMRLWTEGTDENGHRPLVAAGGAR